MSFLSIDQSANLEDGLYTGEEICMLGENDGIATGITQIGVEMELDPEVLSTMTESDDSGSTDAVPVSPLHREFGPPSVAKRRAAATQQYIRASTNRRPPTPIPVVPLGKAVHTLGKRSIPSKLHFVRRQLLTKAQYRLKAMAGRVALSSPRSRSQKALQMAWGPEADHGDSITVSLSRDSLPCSATTASGGTCASNARSGLSSITASTCDFAPEPNLDVIFESYLASNPWEAARRGDYATLSYMCQHDDANIWTQRDARGHVPLYYACAHYAGRGGTSASFGKYGLESIRLLAEAWPRGEDLPRALLERCARRGGLHEDVVEVLSRSNPGAGNALVLCREKAETRIEGVSDVVPVSFLEDLGDDGYVEDY